MWECKCGWKGEEPVIHPGVSGGKVVDVIDIFCMNGNCSNEPQFIGTTDEWEKWWDSWYEKMNKE